MRKQYIISLIILACLNAVAATTINAQSNRRFVIRIPFDFVLADQVLPAGNYAVERVDPTKPNVLMFKNTDNGIVRVFITQRVENEEMSTASCLIFKRWKGESYLFQVWVVGNKDGNQIPPETKRRDRGAASTLVRLKSTTRDLNFSR
jgi:hypothetical protein